VIFFLTATATSICYLPKGEEMVKREVPILFNMGEKFLRRL
jgi:hypothetical protein